MADKTIGELVAATAVQAADLFVLEQNATAKKLTGQILINWMTAYADGHGGIQSIVKTSSTGTNPVVDTYTITLADTTTASFTVTNGVKGDTGAAMFVWIKWAAQNPTADNQMSNSPDAWIGIYTGLSSTAPAHYTDYDWYEYKGDKGDTGVGIGSVSWVANSGGQAQSTPGTYDTYNIYTTDNELVGTFRVYNGNDGEGSPGSSNPLEDGTASPGSANAYSREDHVHPLQVPSTGTPADLGTAFNGSATTYARSDHVHNLPSLSALGGVATSAVLADNTDLDTVVTSGFYRLGTGNTNAPTGSDGLEYGQLIVSAGLDTVTQIGCKADTGYVWTRTGDGIGTVSEAWTSWVQVAPQVGIKHTNITINCYNATWSTSGAGKYYISYANGTAIPGATKILSVSLDGAWGGLRASDIVQPVANNDKVCLMSNVGQFNSSAAVVGISVIYI